MYVCREKYQNVVTVPPAPATREKASETLMNMAPSPPGLPRAAAGPPQSHSRNSNKHSRSEVGERGNRSFLTHDRELKTQD